MATLGQPAGNDSTMPQAGGVRDPAAAVFRGTPRFEILRTIGAGGMGVVFEAQDLARGQRVALKTLRDASPAALLRFKEEFRSHATVYHEHLVRLRELIEHDDHWFFTMELVDGVHFLDWIGDAPLSALGEQRLRHGLGQLASALLALHAAHRVHRDIKSSNVLVTADGRVVVVDFGVVGDISRGAIPDGTILGTLASMAPEQAAGASTGAAADWYAVGVLLYQALTGRRPFYGSPDEILRAKRETSPPAPSTVVAGVPADLEALCLALLERDPAWRAGGAECGFAARTDVARAAGPAVFVGRLAELDVLRGALARVLAGAPETVHIEGASGIGKSELAGWFIDELRGSERALVLLGRCYEHESVPYKAVDGIVDALARRLAALDQRELAALLPREAALLAQTFPVLGSVPALSALAYPDVVASDPQVLRAEMFAAFRAVMQRLAGRCAPVLVVDDVHWADADSLELLGELMRPPHAPPVLLVLVSRGVPGLGARIAHVRRVELGPLSTVDTDQLITRLAGAAAGEVDHARIGRDAGGHPLFIHELVRHQLDHTAGATGASLEDVLWQRIRGLDGDARRLLAVLAVSGQPVSRAVLAAAGVAHIDHSLDVLLGGRLARSLAGADDHVDVYHDRIRRAILGHLDDGERRAHHAALAHAYEQLGANDPEVLATHWQAAGDVERAIDYMIRASRRAAAVLAFDRAARLAEAALGLLPDGASELRAVLGSELGDALAHGGESLRAARAYAAAAAISPTPRSLALQRGVVGQYLRCGHIEEGLTAARAVLGSVGMVMPRTALRATLSALWQRLRVRLRGLGYRPRPAATVPIDQLAQIDVAWTMAIGLGIVDHVRGATFQSRHLMLALRAGEPLRIARALATETAYIGALGRRYMLRARQVSQRALAIADQVGDRQVLGFAIGSTGAAACLAGDWARARELLERGERILHGCVGTDWEMVSCRVFQLTACNYLGEYQELARIDDYLRQARARGDLYAESTLVGRIGWMVALLADQPVEAQRQTRDALQRWTSLGFHTQHRYNLHASTSIGIYAGEPIEVYRALEARWPAFRSSFLLRRVQLARIEMVDVRGRAALAAAVVTPRGAARQALLRRALRDAATLERERAAWATMLATLLRAGAASVDGRRDEALGQFAIADDLARVSQMMGHCMAARRRYGVLTGGADGARIVHAVDSWLRARGVARPDRLAALLAP